MNFSLPLRLTVVVVGSVDDSQNYDVAALADIRSCVHVDRCCILRTPTMVYSVATWSVADHNSFRNDFRSSSACIVDIDASEAAH